MEVGYWGTLPQPCLDLHSEPGGGPHRPPEVEAPDRALLPPQPQPLLAQLPHYPVVGGGRELSPGSRALNKGSRRFHNHGEAPTRAFSWLKVPSSAFTFKTSLRYYAKQTLTPRRFQPGEGPSRRLLRDCETYCETDGALHSTNPDHTTHTIMCGNLTATSN